MEKYNPFAYFYHHLYLLQLEEYDIFRFWKTLGKKWVPLKKRRKEVVWTSKLILVAVVALVLPAVIIYNAVHVIPLFIGMYFVSLYISAFWVSLALIVVSFLDSFVKELIIVKARRKVSQFSRLKVIGVAGSYGKTTMKEALKQLVSQKFKVVVTPGNINTPLGIANIILNEITNETEVFIVEMGEYHRGDVKHICDIVKPQIGIITGINEAHLERMGSIENTIATIFELAEYMDHTGLLVLNADSKLVRERYGAYTKGRNVYLYSSAHPSDLKTQLLGGYAGAVMDGARAVAQSLGISDAEMRIGAAAIVPIPHRLQPIHGQHGILIIDDSYNGSPDGVAEAIRVLAGYQNRRKVYITPGLVEMGERTEAVHHEIGTQLAHVADLVVLIHNSVTPHIERGLRDAGFKADKIRTYQSSEETYSHMSDFARPGDVILFQNDWPDNYV
jgi:UDP-N-acetylmuramoyl-tripeptide--D-alanyl-D-alanine ligase